MKADRWKSGINGNLWAKKRKLLQAAQHHNPKDHIVNIHSHENFSVSNERIRERRMKRRK
jgi:hypothetical protein